MKLTLASYTIAFLLAAAMTCRYGSLQAQEKSPTEDVIYLKDGSIIRGKLLEYAIDGTTRIEIHGATVLSFPYAQISRITVASPEPGTRPRREIRYKEQGYYNVTQMGLLLRNPSKGGYFIENPQSFNLQMVNGYRFNRFLAAGIGTGISFFQRGYMLPVFGELRGDLLKTEITPHYYLSGGYSFPLYDGNDLYWEDANATVKGGPLADMGIGIRIHTPGAVSWVLTAGYRVQTSESQYTDPWSQMIFTENYTHRRLALQLGMMF